MTTSDHVYCPHCLKDKGPLSCGEDDNYTCPGCKRVIRLSQWVPDDKRQRQADKIAQRKREQDQAIAECPFIGERKPQ